MPSTRYGAFGVPIIVFHTGRAVFGPVVVPAPTGAEALTLWDLAEAYSEIPGLFEMKKPKTHDDLRMIATAVRAVPRGSGVGRRSRTPHREDRP